MRNQKRREPAPARSALPSGAPMHRIPAGRPT